MNHKTRAMLEVVTIFVVVFIAIFFLVSWAVGCSSAPSPKVEEGQKIFITVKNTTDKPVYCSVAGGLMSRSVELAPNSESSFWGYRSMIPDNITFSVTDKPAPRRK